MSKHKSIPTATRKKLYEKYNHRCAYCGCELEYKDMQIDHVESVYRNNDIAQTTVKSYAKAGKRNEKAAAHKKIAKHSMHLLRLYMMCIDILEKQKIVTYREKEHDLLMDIRNGKYLGADDKPLPEFFELVSEYEKKLEYAKKNTTLPDEPDYRRIMEFTAYVNEKVVKGEI